MSFGGKGYLPVPADFDGDGKADVVIYSESEGMLKILFSGSGYAETDVRIGGSGYKPVGMFE